MNTLETYQSDAMERPLIRRRLFWALVVSLILHAGIIYWFQQTHLPQFNAAPVERLVPRIFNVKEIKIRMDDDGGDKAAAPPKKVDKKPAAAITLPDEKPMADVTEGKMAPVAPITADLAKPIENEKPKVDSNEAQAIARVDSSAKLVLDQDLNSLRDSLLKDQAPHTGTAGIRLPDSAPADAAYSDQAGMAAASGQLDKMLGHGLRPGTGPVTMPGGALFEFASSDLRTAALEQLQKLGMLIKRNPDVTFTIEGYTDSFGDAAYNKQLSQQRADAVRTWLIQNMDVDPSHIQAVGYGATNFLVKPQEVDMHSQASIDREKLLEQSNRRVEIRFKFHSAQ